MQGTTNCAAALPVAGGTMSGDLILNADPTVPLGAVTKQYADAIAQGLEIKDSCYVATTGALTATYSNGASGIGATLTNSGAQAAFSADGVLVPLNSRVLVKNESTTLRNGIYDLSDTGSLSSNWVLTRSTDYDQPSEIQAGDFIIIDAGNTLATTGWVQTSTVTAVGTDPITFSQFGQTISLPLVPASGGTGVNNGSSTITVGGNVTFSGAHTFTGTLTGNTSVTFPTSGTLATTGSVGVSQAKATMISFIFGR